MKKLKVSILRNENTSSAEKWALACQRQDIAYDIIDLTASNWLDNVLASQADFFLLRPAGMLEHYKILYDERLYIICKVLGLDTFPSYEESYIYENKKLLSYFLAAKGIPHPKTLVFYTREDATAFIDKTSLPVVAKTTIGASGSGVQILRDKEKARKYINSAFSNKGIKRRFGPNRVIGTPGKWFTKAVKSPSYFFKKLKEYMTIYSHGERDLVFFQEYIPHDYEWRAVRIGDSYFAHQKIKYQDKASGSKGIDYVNPPLNLLDLVKNICEANHFKCMAIDLFDDGNGGFLVNELQTIFGHVQDHIMEVDGKPGRYVFQDNQWVFEPGDFNTNESYDLRLKTAISLYEKGMS
jgi:glutathione synthase/RimK-type ligase-like ATP-grasp enzyme